MLDQRRRSFHIGLLAVLLVAGLWRAVMAALMPILSRDGATFCWYARDLGQQGLAFLHDPTTRQHPLYPVLILAVQRGAGLFGAADTPLVWQRCGQLVAWLAGMAAVGLAGAVTFRLVRRLQLPLDERLATLAAMLLAAVLDLNVWLSADVMSDQVHLAFYLAAAWVLLRLDTLRAALACGLLSGLAFLTRQEGFVPILAGLAVLVAHRRQTPWSRLAPRAGALLLGFLVCAAPYWTVVGRFSAKKDPLDAFRQEAGAALTHPSPGLAGALSHGGAGGFMLAKLETIHVSWYGLLPQALYKLLRAGRVIIPLLALWPLVNLRRRLLDPVWCGLTTCLVGHFTLTLVLLKHYGYLDPRHMLVVVLLLVPLAGMQLSRAFALLQQLRRPWLGAALAAAFVFPLAAYSLRVPNSGDRFVADAARWVAAHDPAAASQRLLAGSSLKRIAFYTGMRWEPWMEEPEDYPTLTAQIRSGGPGLFAVECAIPGDTGFERAGNRELVAHVLADADLAPYLGRVETRPGSTGQSELRLIELRSAP